MPQGCKSKGNQTEKYSPELPDDFYENIRDIIREEIKTVQAEIEKSLDTKFKQFTKDIRDRISKIETGLKTVTDDIATIKTDTLPKITSHYDAVLQKLTLSHLDLNVHRRKWGVIISGLDGESGESEKDTRQSVIDLGKKKLKIKDAELKDFSACHRLKSAANAPIIARFTDLSKRDTWMSKAKLLKNTNTSISVDVPPCLRDVKKELVEAKKKLPEEARRRSYIKHYPSFPYFKLIRHDAEPTMHSYSEEGIARKCLDLKDSFALNLAL